MDGEESDFPELGPSAGSTPGSTPRAKSIEYEIARKAFLKAEQDFLGYLSAEYRHSPTGSGAVTPGFFSGDGSSTSTPFTPKQTNTRDQGSPISVLPRVHGQQQRQDPSRDKKLRVQGNPHGKCVSGRKYQAPGRVEQGGADLHALPRGTPPATNQQVAHQKRGPREDPLPPIQNGEFVLKGCSWAPNQTSLATKERSKGLGGKGPTGPSRQQPLRLPPI